jgi:hypothetical protein
MHGGMIQICICVCLCSNNETLILHSSGLAFSMIFHTFFTVLSKYP